VDRRPARRRAERRARGGRSPVLRLAVVVLVAQAAHHLAGKMTWARPSELAVVFTLVMDRLGQRPGLHHELARTR